MIETTYSNEGHCTACVEKRNEVEVGLGLEMHKLKFGLCAACRKELVDRLRPPEAAPKRKG